MTNHMSPMSDPIARCTATAELVDANGAGVGVFLRCELEAGHHVDRLEPLYMGTTYLGRDRIAATEHAYTFRWAEPTEAELAEVYDPAESFDLEVDIADEAALEQQQNAAIDNGALGAGDERDYPRDPEAVRCSACGREAVNVDTRPGHVSYVHRDPMAWRHAVTLD